MSWTIGEYSTHKPNKNYTTFFKIKILILSFAISSFYDLKSVLKELKNLFKLTIPDYKTTEVSYLGHSAASYGEADLGSRGILSLPLLPGTLSLTCR